VDPGPRVLVAALWLDRWVRGEAPADDVLGGICAVGGCVVAWPDEPPGPAADLLGWIRRSGADRAWLVLPRPGRTLGWPPGAPGLPEPAVLLSAGGQPVGLVRAADPGWRVTAAAGADLPALAAQACSARAGARQFGGVVAGAAHRIARLGLDRAAAGPLAGPWSRALSHLPHGTEPDLAALLHRIGQVLDALAVAQRDDGAAVTAGEALARSRELRHVAGEVEDVVVGVVAGLGGTLAR
jgi:hypothetical protein